MKIKNPPLVASELPSSFEFPMIFLRSPVFIQLFYALWGPLRGPPSGSPPTGPLSMGSLGAAGPRQPTVPRGGAGGARLSPSASWFLWLDFWLWLDGFGLVWASVLA